VDRYFSLPVWLSKPSSLDRCSARAIQFPRDHPAIVTNRGKDPVTFCVEFGQYSLASPSDQPESTPIPFLVQQYSTGTWSILLIGPDIGSIRAPVMLGPGKSISYPFRVAGNGKVRLLLFYWTGDQPDFSCENPPKRHSRVESKPFLLVDPNDKNRNSLSPRSGNYTATPHPTYLVAPCCQCYFQAGVEFLRGVSSWLLALMICCAAP
jgi:hypothetical protein